MLIRVRNVEFFLTDCDTRLPFKFGQVTMTRAPYCVARARVETEDGAVVEGHAADLLVPKWFEKDAKKTVTDDWFALLGSARSAANAFTESAAGEGTLFDHWWRVYRARVAARDRDASDLLVRGFGVALVERAAMDAVCRAAGVSFFDALKRDLFGFRPGEVHPELAGWSLAASLPEAPSPSVLVRHTIGGTDPLRASEITPENRVDDGLPQALEEDIERYGLTHFKVKIGAGRATDLARLLELGRLFRERVGDATRITADGNEQFSDLDELAGLFTALADSDDGRWFLDRMLFVEQPLHRAATFDPARNAAMPALAEIAPVIIDEADTGIDAFPRARALGYHGVSVKNCKGVFRALLNRGLCELAGDGSFQSAEDLTNLPVLALQQDLATVAALALPHVERNGHHYFRGLAHLPRVEAEAALAAHPDLYEERDGAVVLAIRNGRLQMSSIQSVGYGYDLRIRVDERVPASRWVEQQI